MLALLPRQAQGGFAVRTLAEDVLIGIHEGRLFLAGGSFPKLQLALDPQITVVFQAAGPEIS